MEISYLQKTCTCGISLLIPPWPCKVSCLDHCSSGRGSHWKRWECGSIPRVGRRMCALGSPGMWGLVGHWTDGGLRIAQPAGCLTPAVPWPQHSHKPPLLSSLQTVLSWVHATVYWADSAPFFFAVLIFFLKLFLFIWLCRVFVVALRIFDASLGIFGCGTQPLEHEDAVLVALGLSCSIACGILGLFRWR